MSTTQTRRFSADTSKLAYAQAFSRPTAHEGARTRTRRHLSRLIRRTHRS